MSQWLGLVLLAQMAAPVHAFAAYSATLLFSLTPASGYPSNTLNVSTASSNNVTGYVLGSTSPNLDRPLLWNNTSTPLDLTPTNISGYSSSILDSAVASQQIGYGEGPATGTGGSSGLGTGYSDHALIWNGSANSAVDLNPTNLSGITTSHGYGTDGTYQVGDANGSSTGGNTHAMLWNGTAGSAIDLNPTALTGFTTSYALKVRGGQQVGYGSGSATGDKSHALLWSGTASSAVDLQPTLLTGYADSYGKGTTGSQQFGYAVGPATGGTYSPHAMIWNGTADSAIDLHPTLLSVVATSMITDSNGYRQVGFGHSTLQGETMRALTWTGTADSAIDLAALLPTSYHFLSSQALGVDNQNNIWGFAKNSTGFYAVEWSSTELPEPAGPCALIIAAATVAVRRPRRPGRAIDIGQSFIVHYAAMPFAERIITARNDLARRNKLFTRPGR